MAADTNANRRAETTTDQEELAVRLREARLTTLRMVNLHDGTKQATGTHYHHDPGEVTGNYGVYAGGGLVLVDIDDYNGGDTTPLEALPETYTVRTPHGGEHRYYRVEEEVAAVLLEAIGVKNPVPSWGEVRVDNQYVVGPGSVLTADGCTKEDCDTCGTYTGGRYAVLHDRPIATIAAEELVEVVRADPVYAERKPQSRPPTQEPSTESESTGDEYEPLPWEWNVNEAMEALPGEDTFWERKRTMLFGNRVGPHIRKLMRGEVAEAGYVTDAGEPDRSRAEVALGGHLGFWFHRDRDIARYVLDNIATVSKWWESPHHREDVLQAVEEAEEVYVEPSTESKVSVSVKECVAFTLHNRGEASLPGLVEDPLNPAGRTQTYEALRELEDAGYVDYEKRGRSGVYQDLDLEAWLW